MIFKWIVNSLWLYLYGDWLKWQWSECNNEQYRSVHLDYSKEKKRHSKFLIFFFNSSVKKEIKILFVEKNKQTNNIWYNYYQYLHWDSFTFTFQLINLT